MNKADITIMRIKACKDYKEAVGKILDPIKGFGYNLTNNERSFCLEVAKLYFRGE